MSTPPTYKGLKWDADRQKLMVIFEGTALFDVDEIISSTKIDSTVCTISNIYTEGTDLIVVSTE